MSLRRYALMLTVCVGVLGIILVGCGEGNSSSAPEKGEGRTEQNADSEETSGYMETLTKTYRKGHEDPPLLAVRNELKQFHALKGRWPESLEEFTEWRGAELPDLPQGRRFQYDPKTGNLKIVDAE